MTERVALITGASAGIGMELARIFAAKGHRVALTARRADRLNELAGEIVAAGGTQPIVIPCDLEQADACDTIEGALAAAGVELEYLVNNAGFGVFGHAIKRDRNDQLGMIAVNIRALTDLTLRFADQLARHRGGVLNIGSIAGFLPGPGMAIYYASKAYVLSFSEAMRHELAPQGARHSGLPWSRSDRIPGEGGVRAGVRSAILNVSPAQVAQQGYDGLMAGKRAVLPGVGIKMVPLLLRFFPGCSSWPRSADFSWKR